MLEPEELLKTWPSWRKTSADKVLSSPAWRMDVVFARQKDRLTIDNVESADEIYLKVSLDDSEHILGIRDSERFPDLHLLWTKKNALDKNIVLALVEKECGALFVLLEHVFGREVKVKGLVDKPSKGIRTTFRTSAYAFSIDLSSEMRLSLGDISYLDPSHDSIRAMTRVSHAEYFACDMSEAEISELKEGDVIPLGVDYLNKASWNLEGFNDSLVHIIDANETNLRFADFVDESLPKIPAGGSMLLVKGSSVIAEGESFVLGGIPCFKLTRMHS